MSTNETQTVTLDSKYERELAIHPRLPYIDGIFDLGSNVLIASHQPHEHIREHLHDHLPAAHPTTKGSALRLPRRMSTGT